MTYMSRKMSAFSHVEAIVTICATSLSSFILTFNSTIRTRSWMCSAVLYDRRCLSVCLFVIFCPHFIEWCVFRAGRQIRRGVKWDVEKKHKYTHPTTNSRPSDNHHDDVGDYDDQYNHVRVWWSNLYSPPPSLVRLVMVSKDVLVESPHSLTMYLKLMFREAVNLRVVIDCVLCVYTFVLMMIMIHVQMTQL